ncbi:Holliday junction branch migration DNA helicase RuvB [Patescibacteria group bacterium]|nr:Holliday junction branch migration DNA helicase RuvB [Patescibacteria group bacterium]
MSRKKIKEIDNTNTKKTEITDDSFLDQTLRPTRFEEYIGQKHIKDNVKILLKAAEERGHIPEHLLFYGPPGLGKTTLAHLIAHETGRQMKITSGPAIEKVGDLASILTNLAAGDILFIDEIHRLNKMVEEILYPAMESGVLDIIIGKGPSARTIQLDLPPFTLIAATTRVAMVSSPLRSRFSGGVFRLEFYSNEEIAKIIERSSKLLKIKLEEEALKEIAKRSRFTPRTANYFLKRCRDFAQIYEKGKEKILSQKICKDALNMLAIDDIGLNSSDRKFLEILIEKFNGGPVGLKTMSAALSEEEATLEEVVEPYLIQLGLLERTARGRVATGKACEHLGFNTKEEKQNKLI